MILRRHSHASVFVVALVTAAVLLCAVVAGTSHVATGSSRSTAFEQGSLPVQLLSTERRAGGHASPSTSAIAVTRGMSVELVARALATEVCAPGALPVRFFTPLRI